MQADLNFKIQGAVLVLNETESLNEILRSRHPKFRFSRKNTGYSLL